MNGIMKFENGEFGEVESIFIKGKIYFKALPIARKLGYDNPNNAIKRHCPHTLKQVVGVKTGVKSNGEDAIQNVKMNFIPEGDVYRLIIRSKLPSAERFETWLFDEVLPQIRVTGGYLPIKFGDSQEDIENRAREILKSTLEEKDSLISLQQDKIERSNKAIKQLIPFYKFTKAVREGSGLMSLEEVAKTLFEHNGRIGRNTFIGILRDWKILNDKNLPYQKYINSGYFSVKFKRINKYDEYYSQPVTLVTGKGLTYLTNKILNEFSKDGAKDEM